MQSVSDLQGVEVLEPAEEFCKLPCCPSSGGVCRVRLCPTCEEEDHSYVCGGEAGRISVFYHFAAPVTIGLNIEVVNTAGENVAIHYDNYSLQPAPSYMTESHIRPTGAHVDIKDYKRLNVFEVSISLLYVCTLISPEDVEHYAVVTLVSQLICILNQISIQIVQASSYLVMLEFLISLN